LLQAVLRRGGIAHHRFQQGNRLVFLARKLDRAREGKVLVNFLGS